MKQRLIDLLIYIIGMGIGISLILALFFIINTALTLQGL